MGVLGALWSLSCGTSSDHGDGRNDGAPGANGSKGTPRFVFSSKPPGRAVGIHARASFGAMQAKTGDYELALMQSDGKKPATSTSTQSLRLSLGQQTVERTTGARAILRRRTEPATVPTVASLLKYRGSLGGTVRSAPRGHFSVHAKNKVAIGSANVAIPITGHARARSGGDGIGTLRTALCDAKPGDMPATIPTDGTLCWIAEQVGVGVFEYKNAKNHVLIFGDQFRYLQTYTSQDVYFPPDFVNVGATTSFGCMRTPNTVPSTTMVDISGVGFSTSLGEFNVILSGTQLYTGSLPTGFTLFRDKDNHFVRGMQLDASTSFGLSPLLLESPVTVSLQIKSVNDVGPIVSATTTLCDAANLMAPNMSACPQKSGSCVWEQTLNSMNEAIQPLQDDMMDAKGEPPGPNVVAGTNADALANLGSSGEGENCSGCPATSVEGLSERAESAIESSSTGEDILGKAPDLLKQLPNTLPSPDALDVLAEQARSGIELAESLREQQANNGKNIFTAPGVDELKGSVGQPVSFRIEPSELATLLNRPEADVIGATLTVDGSPVIDPSTFTLDAGGLEIDVTPGSTDPIVIRISADLGTAAGTFPAESKDWFIALTPRTVNPEAGEPAGLTISGPSTIASGGSAALNARVVDANGNTVTAPAHVTFEDGDGNRLGEADTNHGVATIECVPVASTPGLTSVERTTLVRSDDTQAAGIIVMGTNLSVDIAVYANGALVDTSAQRDPRSANEVRIAADIPAGATVHVVNPGGQESNELEATDVQ
jgi:hypothetical protein